jgi:hypothetical protein
MPNQSKWTLPACVLAAACTFGVVTWFLVKTDKQVGGTPQPQPQAQEPAEEPVKLEEPARKVDDSGSTTLKPEPVPARPRSALLRKWTVPAKTDPDKSEDGSYDVHELQINADGTRLLSRSKREVVYWNASYRIRLQTYEPAKPRWHYQEPNTKHMFLSPDCRFVATMQEKPDDSREVTVRQAESGRLQCTAQLDKTTSLHSSTPEAYTAAGDYLFLNGSCKYQFTVQAVSLQTGTTRVVNLPVREGDHRVCLQLLPVPGQPVFLLFRDDRSTKSNPSGIAAFDLTTGKETPLTCLTVVPWHLFFERGVQLSHDGKRLLAGTIEQVQVCDWQTNRRLFELKEGMVNYLHFRFTPDGSRILFVREPKYEIIRIGGDPGRKPDKVVTTIELYDLVTKKRIAQYVPEKQGIKKRITALALSQDGKTLALAEGRDIYVLDFEAAFGVPPLAPVLPSTEPVALPLK